MCPWPGSSFSEAGKGFGEPITAETLARLDAHGWELYNVTEDPAECHDVAAEHRDRLIALIATWYVEAGKYDVMPVDGSGLARFASEKPMIAARRDRFVYYLNTQSVPSSPGRACSTVRTASRPTSRSPTRGRRACCTGAGGLTLYVRHGRLQYTHNWVGRELMHLESDAEVSAGRHTLRSEFEPQGPPDPAKGHGTPGRFQLYLDGELVGDREVPYTTPFAFNPGVLTCGADPGLPVTTDYQGPFRFTGTIHTVTVDLSGELISDPEAELKLHMARQ